MLLNWLFIIGYPQHKLVGTSQPHVAFKFIDLAHKIKTVIARWISLLLIEADGCSIIFVKATNPSIIKVVIKSPCITHPPLYNNYIVDQEPRIGV